MEQATTQTASEVVQITYHQDPGHGWFEVPVALLQRLGISREITGYSYLSHETAYLEEDCDAGTFHRAIEEAGLRYELRDAYTDNESFIRRLPRYPGAR